MIHQSSRAWLTGAPAKRGWRRWDTSTKATVIFGAVGAVVAIFAWLLPQSPDGDSGALSTPRPPPSSSSSRRQPVTTSASGLTAGPAAGVDYLDSGVITAQAGGDRLAELPRKLRGGASYTDHPLAIRCPSNQTGDESSDVTYALRGHYVSFDATVRPYYPTSADQRSATYVYAIAGITQRDGDLSTAIVGQQLRASPTTPAAMSADVDGAQELTLRVKCSDPDGIVVLTDARLTVAG